VPDDAALEEIAAVCARLDGIPLAIELAASRVSVLSPGELLAHLDDRFRLLSGGRRRARGRTLAATLDWSYDLLDAEQQRIFRALGVFAGSFDLNAVAAVADLSADDARDEIESLYNRSLVTRMDDQPGRFRLLETMKSYAEDRLVEAGEASAVRRAHADHFLERAHTDSALVATSWTQLARLAPDRHDLIACADWLEAEGRSTDLARQLGILALISYGEAATTLPRLVRCRSSLPEGELVDWLRVGETYLYMALGDWRRYVETALALQRSGTPRSAAFGHRAIAIVLARIDPDAAMECVDRYAELYGDDPTGRAPTIGPHLALRGRRAQQRPRHRDRARRTDARRPRIRAGRACLGVQCAEPRRGGVARRPS
jgi:hypothetical protein